MKASDFTEARLSKLIKTGGVGEFIKENPVLTGAAGGGAAGIGLGALIGGEENRVTGAGIGGTAGTLTGAGIGKLLDQTPSIKEYESLKSDLRETEEGQEDLKRIADKLKYMKSNQEEELKDVLSNWNKMDSAVFFENKPDALWSDQYDDKDAKNLAKNLKKLLDKIEEQ